MTRAVKTRTPRQAPSSRGPIRAYGEVDLPGPQLLLQLVRHHHDCHVLIASLERVLLEVPMPTPLPVSWG